MFSITTPVNVNLRNEVYFGLPLCSGSLSAPLFWRFCDFADLPGLWFAFVVCLLRRQLGWPSNRRPHGSEVKMPKQPQRPRLIYYWYYVSLINEFFIKLANMISGQTHSESNTGHRRYNVQSKLMDLLQQDTIYWFIIPCLRSVFFFAGATVYMYICFGSL